MHKQRIQLSRFFNDIESTLLECENLSDTFLKDWIKAKTDWDKLQHAVTVKNQLQIHWATIFVIKPKI